ncbi:periphilin-1 isoform X7 [Cavia porcellus]|uniref:periphilin-1 isoform X7 n=1 Tax=Cavia porcellus TaxID=10141 RepID=UPI002FE39552
MFNLAGSSPFMAYTVHNLWYLAVSQQPAPVVLGGQQQPQAGNFPTGWWWNRTPPTSSLLEQRFPPLPAANIPGPQPLLALKNGTPMQNNKPSTETKKAVVVAALQPIMSEQDQTDDMKTSMEEFSVPVPACAGEEDSTAEVRGEVSEGSPVVSSGLLSASGKVADGRNEMWSEGRYDYERLPRERVPPRSHSSDESGYRWSRDDHSASRQSDYRDMRDGFRRRSFYSSHYTRDRSPHTRELPFFRESPVGRKDSPHSRSGSSVSSRSYSPDRSKAYSFHQSQHRSKERPVPSMKTSRDTSPSSSPAGPSSKALDKPSRLTEKELAEAASKWAAEKLEKSEETNVPGISEFQVQSGPLKSLCVPTVWNQAGSSPPLELEKLAVQSLPGMSSTKKKMDPRPSTTHSSGPTWGDIKKLTYHAEQTLKFTGAPFSPENLFLPMIEQITSNSKATKVGPTTQLFIENPEETDTNATDSTELFEDSQLSSRSKAIALKTKEIEQVYRQDCETFGMVVKMLIEKDPSLEKSIQFALRQNLHEIGERCVEELKHFIAEYDTSTQDFGEPF